MTKKQSKQKNTIINSYEKIDKIEKIEKIEKIDKIDKIEKIDNISFFFHEEECKENSTNNTDIDINSFLDNCEIEKTDKNPELFIPHIFNYQDNFTIKELLLICEYYGIAKELKLNKCNKEKIIYFLVDFESNSKNFEIVCKRQTLWFYINEIKNDKFMKKYLLL
jgi:hypothetical protein